MKNLLTFLMCGVLLATVTSLAAWYGFRSEGGTDSIHWYAFPGLPFAFAVLLLAEWQPPVAVAVAAGFLAQFACCLAVLGLAWAAWNALRPKP